jgi:5-methyltetrahydropteroyltriglutamate--homocysteine methyltransferase
MSLISPGLYLASSGSYPRTGTAAEFQLLSTTVAAFDRGERSAADVLDAENDVMRRVIADQVKAGVEVVTDGQVRWRDPISHLAAKLENVKIQGSSAFPGTNSEFRQPVLTGKPIRKRPLVLDDYNFARNALGRLPTPRALAGKLKIKPVLTGPYTMAKCSLFDESAANGANGAHGSASTTPITSLSSLEARALAYTEVLAAEIIALAQAGADLIQIDEPVAIRNPEDWLIFKRSIVLLVEARDSTVKAGRGSDLVLHVCFHDCAPLYEKLVSLPVDIIGLDLSCSPKLADVITAAGSPKPLVFGIVDGRNPYLEDIAPAARQVERMLSRIEGGRAYLAPSCGLDRLSQEQAYDKLELLSKIRDAVTA